MLNYIKRSLVESNKAHKSLRIHNVPVNIIAPFTNDIDPTAVFAKIQKIVPLSLVKNVDVFYVANIEDFQRENGSFNALYKDGAIYISSEQDSEADLIDDLIHEIAHSLEKEYQDEIYGDGNLEREFLGKRRTLHYLVDKPTLSMVNYNNAEYNKQFDLHMYEDLGYDYLRTLSAGLFYSPYAITSLREYWANGFENYLLGDRSRLKDLSPVLYNVVYNIINNSEEYS